MTKIIPTFLEMSFYFAETPDAAAFLRVLGALTREGARFAGQGIVHRGPGIGQRPFGAISDELSDEVSLSSMQEAEVYATADDTRLIQVALLEQHRVAIGGRNRDLYRHQ